MFRIWGTCCISMSLSNWNINFLQYFLLVKFLETKKLLYHHPYLMEKLYWPYLSACSVFNSKSFLHKFKASICLNQMYSRDTIWCTCLHLLNYLKKQLQLQEEMCLGIRNASPVHKISVQDIFSRDKHLMNYAQDACRNASRFLCKTSFSAAWFQSKAE